MNGELEIVDHQQYGMCLKLSHPQDIAIAQIMQGALLNKTILPSGITTPPKDMILKEIYLCQSKPPKIQSKLRKKVYRILARTQWSNEPSDFDQFVEALSQQQARQKFKPMGTLKIIHSIIQTNLESANQLKAYRMEISLGTKKMREEIIFGIDGPSISTQIFSKEHLHAHAIDYLGPVRRNL